MYAVFLFKTSSFFDYCCVYVNFFSAIHSIKKIFAILDFFSIISLVLPLGEALPHFLVRTSKAKPSNALTKENASEARICLVPPLLPTSAKQVRQAAQARPAQERTAQAELRPRQGPSARPSGSPGQELAGGARASASADRRNTHSFKGGNGCDVGCPTRSGFVGAGRHPFSLSSGRQSR